MIDKSREPTDQQPEPQGGPGGFQNSSPRGEDGLTEIRSARLTRRAIDRGWIGAKRWPTTATMKEVVEDATEIGGLTGVHKATITAHKLMDSQDNRSKSHGARLLVLMESQNQKDEHHEDGETIRHELGSTPEVIAAANLAAREYLELQTRTIDEHESSGNGNGHSVQAGESGGPG